VHHCRLTGHTAQGDPSPATASPMSPMWSTITVQLSMITERRRETVTWYQPPRDTKTAGAVLGVGHQRQMTPHPPPPAGGSDNNSQLSITLTFLQISLSLKLTECTSWFVTIGRNGNNILSINVSINQTCPKLVSHHHHHFLYWKLTKRS